MKCLILLPLLLLLSCQVKNTDVILVHTRHTAPENPSCKFQYDSISKISYCINPDTIPSYRGGLTEMYKIVSDKIKYPDDKCPTLMDSKIFVRCIISEEGKVIAKRIIKGYPEDKRCSANQDMLELVDYFTQWNPAKCNGKPVVGIFVIPIRLCY